MVAAFELSLSTDSRAKGKIVESVIAHSLSEEKNRVQKFLTLLPSCSTFPIASVTVSSTPKLYTLEAPEYVTMLTDPTQWTSEAKVIVPAEDATGAGPDINIIVKLSDVKIAIFISLKTSKKPIVKCVCEDGIFTTNPENFWGKRAVSGEWKEYKDKVLESLKDTLICSVQISLPECANHTHVPFKCHEKDIVPKIMGLKEVDEFIHYEARKIVKKAFLPVLFPDFSHTNSQGISQEKRQRHSNSTFSHPGKN